MAFRAYHLVQDDSQHTDYGIPVLAKVPEIRDWCYISEQLERDSKIKPFPVHKWQQGQYHWQRDASYLLGRDVKKVSSSTQAPIPLHKKDPRPVWLQKVHSILDSLIAKRQTHQRLRRYVPKRKAQPKKKTDSHFLL